MMLKPDTAERNALLRLEEAAREDRRKRFTETTMAERIEVAFELADLSRELRAGVSRAT